MEGRLPAAQFEQPDLGNGSSDNLLPLLSRKGRESGTSLPEHIAATHTAIVAGKCELQKEKQRKALGRGWGAADTAGTVARHEELR
jgi:hypothetical protein